MSSFLCFVCHSTVNSDTNEEIREKYKEVVGMQLCVDSPLCHICCHVLNKLWLFRAVCLKRSLEYPVLFSEKGTLNLQRNDVEVLTICSETSCHHFRNRNVNSGTFDVLYEGTKGGDSDEYVQLQDDHNEFDDGFGQVDSINDLHNDDVNEHEYNDYNNHSLEQSETPEEYCDFDAGDQNIDTNNHNVGTNNQNCNTNSQGFVKDNESNSDDENIDDENHDFNTNNQNYEINTINENIEKSNNDNNNIEINEATNNDLDDDTETSTKKTKKKSKKHKKKSFEKIVLTLEEQKQELERRRKEKKYLEAEFKCHSCALSFLFKDTYQTHMMRHEESNGEHVCLLCGLRFAVRGVLRAHCAAHTARYRCRKCGGAARARGRPAHRRRCWGEGGQPGACHLCGRTFRDRSGLQQHLRRSHGAGAGGAAGGAGAGAAGGAGGGGAAPRLACGACAHRAPTHQALRTHMLKHLTRKFPCSECGSELSSPYSLAQHKKKHEAHELHYCRPCARAFTSRKGLRAHLNNTLAHRQHGLECGVSGRRAHAGPHGAGSGDAARRPRRQGQAQGQTQTQTQTQAGPANGKTAYCHYCGAGFKGNNKLNRHLREVCEKNRAAEELARLYENSCLHPS